ncbi:Uncharacterised protein [uncultured archaeon]|nr:Uncharacterised protein [uncultured archaeon]
MAKIFNLDTQAIWAPKKSQMANDMMERLRKNSFNRHGLCREDITREPKIERANRMKYDFLPLYAIGTLHTRDQLLAALSSMATGNAKKAFKIKETLFYTNTDAGGGAFDGKMLDALITEGGRAAWSDITPITRFYRKTAEDQFLGIITLLASWEPTRARKLLENVFSEGFFKAHLAENEATRSWAEKYTNTQLGAALAFIEFANATGDGAMAQMAKNIVNILHQDGGVFKGGFFYPAMDDNGMMTENSKWLGVSDQLLAVVLYSRLGEAREARRLMHRLMKKTGALERGYFNSSLTPQGEAGANRKKMTATQFAGILAFNALEM